MINGMILKRESLASFQYTKHINGISIISKAFSLVDFRSTNFIHDHFLLRRTHATGTTRWSSLLRGSYLITALSELEGTLIGHSFAVNIDFNRIELSLVEFL